MMVEENVKKIDCENYSSARYYLEIPGKIPPSFPLPKGGISIFGKWFDEAHHHELVEGEGLGEIAIEPATRNPQLVTCTYFNDIPARPGIRRFLSSQPPGISR